MRPQDEGYSGSQSFDNYEDDGRESANHPDSLRAARSRGRDFEQDRQRDWRERGAGGEREFRRGASEWQNREWPNRSSYGSNASRGGDYGPGASGYGERSAYQSPYQWGYGRDAYAQDRESLGQGGQGYGQPAYGQGGYGRQSHTGYGASERYTQAGQMQSGYGQGTQQGSYGQQGGYGQGGYAQGQGAYAQGGYGQSGGASFDGFRSHRRHQGRPPKGYERSDERIRELISERLMEDPSIDAGDVSIQVASGRVTLDGTVQERRQKYAIEEVAEEYCAKDVQNNIRVAGGSFGASTSARSGETGSAVSTSDSDISNSGSRTKKN